MMLGPAGSEIRRFYGLELGVSGSAGDLLRSPSRESARKWLGGNPIAFGLSCLLALYFLVLYVGMALSIRVVASDASRAWSHALLTAMLLYMMALSAGPEAYARFRVPIMPLISIYAALGFSLLATGVWRRPNDARVSIVLTLVSGVGTLR